MPAIASISVADAPEVWSALGFAVTDGQADVGGVRLRLGAAGTGVRAWGLADIDGAGLDGDLDGLPTTVEEAEANPADHPNGVVEVDHVVVWTPDHARTLAALQRAGLELRRGPVEGGTYGSSTLQAFFRPQGGIVEVVGPGQPDPDPAVVAGPARFFGLALTCADLDATAAYLGDRLKPAKPAVQPGRRIATLAQNAGSTVPLAFMSPHVTGPA